jgi:ornithine cyclodeaminase/alanine dehydrogenase-like protein (mu-crystallin family)
MPRQRARVGKGMFNLMGASYGPKAVFGLKAYYGGGNAAGARYHSLLYSATDGKLLAMIECDALGQMRTGAASGLATKVLANADAKILGVIGGGRQAFTQVEAVCAVRPISDIRVFTRTAEHREQFSRELEKHLKIAAKPVASADACVSGADVIITITKAAAPVFNAASLKPGAHVNAAGANSADRRELDAETVLRANLRATDQVAQAQFEACEYRELVAANKLKWSDIVELGDLVTKKVPGRKSATDITLFKSLGLALEDVAFGELIYRRAIEQGVGRAM